MTQRAEADVEKVARAIAEGLGDDFDNAFTHKSAWNAARGERGGRYRDINEPFQPDYLEAARAALAAMQPIGIEQHGPAQAIRTDKEGA